MHSDKMVFFNQVNSLFSLYHSDLLEFVIAEFIDHLPDIRIKSGLIFEQLLNLQPFVVLDDDHNRDCYFVPVLPKPPSPLSVSLSSSTSFKVTSGTGTICI